MEHIINNPALDHIDVAILCWASENSPFSEQVLQDRFPGVPGIGPSGKDALCGVTLRGLIEQFYLSKEIGPDGVPYYAYIPPPDAADIPPLFKEFCHNYAAAGGKVQSVPFCWKRFKLHKSYKSYVKLLGPALDAQIADRERRKQKGDFVAPWRNLSTWINQRGWEDLVSDDIEPSDPMSSEMQQYAKWLVSKYGPTAKPLLTEAQYISFIRGTGAFSRILTLLGYRERLYIFEHAHSMYMGGATAGLSCYDFLVKLYKSKSE